MFDASTSTQKVPSSFGSVRSGSVVITSSIVSKAFFSSVSHFQTFSPFPPFSAVEAENGMFNLQL
jgi:hypothetical protein